MAIDQGFVQLEMNCLFAEGTVTGLSDAQLLARFLAERDGVAFEALVRRHGPMVLSVCRAILRDPNDAEDAFQATFLVLVRKAASIRGRNGLGGWLHRVAYRVAIQANAAAARRRLRERQAGQTSPRISPTGAGHLDEFLPALHDEIARLPEKYRLAVVLCDLQGLPQAEAARQLRWSERALRYKLSEARERLKGRLTRRGLTLDSSTMGALFLREARAAVPAAWRETTIQAALAAANHAAIAGAVSAAASELTGEALNTMFLSNLKTISLFALLGVAVVSGVAVVAQQITAPPNARPRDKAVQNPATSEQPLITRRLINKPVRDFPEKTDLSTPEAAQAAWNRASARMDDQAVLELSWIKWGRRDIEQMKQYRQSHPKETEIYNEAQRNAEILEVATYRADLADVTTRLKFPGGVGRDPYSLRTFGRIGGVWKNLGEDRLPSLEAARAACDHGMVDELWSYFEKVRERFKKGETVSVGRDSENRGARIAPGEPMGISVEKADLMGRVEWIMLHGARDITARKSIEWGEIERDQKGNRTIRYKYYATIWDKDVYIMNHIFTFDAKGNLLDRQDVEGFPQKKVEKPVDVSTQEGMKELVEDFFSKNYRDITSRESLEWGEVLKATNGNYSIHFKYRARIWDKKIKMMNQIFTFDPKGKFVSVSDVAGFPRNE
jgi:RNA polymerase sigma factor (sigma-70 family)